MNLTRVAVYRRTVAAPLPRVWENVLDWEHLPWLHRSTFRAIALLDAGPWGWRARVGLQPPTPGREIALELRLDRTERRYVSRTTDGPGAGTEIWTRLAPEGGRTRIEVAFDVPGVARADVDRVGRGFVRLYTRLWDEDESMMVRREALLASAGGCDGEGPARAESAGAREASVPLGPLAALRERLPLRVEVAGVPFRVLEVDGELRAHATRCPHMLGPLDEVPVEDGCLRCPWHGYRYELATGACLERPALRLASARLEVDRATSAVRLIADPQAGGSRTARRR